MVVRTYRYIVQLLILVAIGVVIAISQLPDGNLHIIACDVGQGDAILVTYKNIQILTDGGPDSSVLNCLGRHIPFGTGTLNWLFLLIPTPITQRDWLTS